MDTFKKLHHSKLPRTVKDLEATKSRCRYAFM